MEVEDKKRLIPLKIQSLDFNHYSIKIGDNEPIDIVSDESSIRRGLLRLKAMDGGEKTKRSSKNGTYKSMLDKDIYIWKSKCPQDVKELESIFESVTTKNNIKNIQLYELIKNRRK